MARGFFKPGLGPVLGGSANSQKGETDEEQNGVFHRLYWDSTEHWQKRLEVSTVRRREKIEPFARPVRQDRKPSLGRLLLTRTRRSGTINKTANIVSFMQTPTSTPLVTLGLCALLALSAATQLRAEDKKADPTGTWTWTMPGRQGGADRKITAKLKADGEKVTGTVTSPGRQGQTSDTAIEDGKLKGDEISFTVTREVGGSKFSSKYNGKISGDSIKGKVETERNGNTNSRDWEAKREK